ncbi:MAG: fibronectin type III domain-containing protein [Candidatus Colwellbacteria bacterium]|nr:fibronectin type III domain-containing protein [Candidatus Colwellbacteria bacterium]
MALAWFLMAGNSLRADDITLAWDQSQGATGYKLYYGTASRVYTTTIDVGNVFQYTIRNLQGFAAPINVRFIIGIATKPAGAVIGWDSVAGATGYKIKYGTAAGNYSKTIDVGNVTQYLITELAPATRYYVAVSSYGAGTITYWFAATAYAPGMESDYSTEVSYRASESRDSAEFNFLTFPVPAGIRIQ